MIRDVELVLSAHALSQIRSRFRPKHEADWAVDQLGRGVQDGVSRFGREVWRTHEATMVIARRPGCVVVVTVLPADWPVEVVGREYAWRDPSELPASPGALARLAERFRGR